MNKKFLATFLAFSILFAIGTVVVYAQPGTTNPNPTGGTTNPNTKGGTTNTAKDQNIGFTIDNPFKGEGTLQGLLKTIINDILLPIGGVLAVLAFIWSGFMYVTAQGNESKLKDANRALLYTAIGTAVLLGAWVISQVIQGTIDQLRS